MININFKQLEIMKKLVSVTCPKLDKPHYYLTSGKTYEVIKEEDGGFEIINNNGSITYSVKSESGHIEYKRWILNYEPDTTERSREIVSKLLSDKFHSTNNDEPNWAYSEEYIQAAKDFGLDELANEMEDCLK